ncbi:MAG: hypothetical protein ABL886_17230, partial [Rhodoglobus sp.]
MIRFGWFSLVDRLLDTALELLSVVLSDFLVELVSNYQRQPSLTQIDAQRGRFGGFAEPTFDCIWMISAPGESSRSRSSKNVASGIGA